MLGEKIVEGFLQQVLYAHVTLKADLFQLPRHRFRR